MRLPCLQGDLFSYDAITASAYDLHQCRLSNEVLLRVIKDLGYFENDKQLLIAVNYGGLDVEEFGSVYEGLLELKLKMEPVPGSELFSCSFDKSTERSSSGSHYTPEELVQPLIKHSLDYIIEERLKNPSKYISTEQRKSLPSGEVGGAALLSIRVCDVACGSGHILLSAARKIALALARVETGEEQPNPKAVRHAMREVIRHCIYGVDKNPLAVELCKVAFWLESYNPGEPLGFLDHHIKCGDSIVGLAHREELENGIADEAFKTLPGDDKEIAAAFLKKNKQESRIRKDKETGTQFKLTDTIDNTVQESMTEYRTFNQLPEHTPNEIAAKARAYRKFMDGKGYNFLKVMADTQVAQFFIPKTTANKDRLITDSDFMTILKGFSGWQNQQTAYAVVVAQERRFFHWFLEFPEIFQNGGFDCILGNPPFLGGKKLSGAFGDNFLECIKFQFAPIGAVDLVTYFFRRIFGIIKQGGFQSLISTNTIAQGKTREDGLDIIIKQGGSINYAVKSIKWPGVAAVDVSLLSITKQVWKRKFILEGKEVNTITSYLDNAETLVNPYPLKKNESKSFVGSFVLGKGYVLEAEEAEALISKDIRNREVLFPYLSGDDLNNASDQSPSRWVINFFDWPEEQAKTYPDCYSIVEQLVKPERQRWAVDKDGKEIEGEYALRKPLPEKWWIYADKRPALYHTISEMERTLVINRYSKSIGAYFSSQKAVYSDSIVVIADSTFQFFTFFSSILHDLWAWKNSSTMGTGTIRYSGSDAFETFPFLISKFENLENIGKIVYDFRQQLMQKIQLGHTKTYNAFHAKEIRPGIATLALQNLDKKAIDREYGKEAWHLWNHLQKIPATSTIEEAVAGIIQLRELHVQMDNAVLEAYGWGPSQSGIVNNEPISTSQSPIGGAAIQLRHDFYEVDYLPENDRIRYTIHPEARKEILKRLLELNHQIHEEEIKQGLHKKADVEKFYAQKGQPVPQNMMSSDTKPKKKILKKENIQTQVSQRNLFDDVNNTIMKEFSLYEGIYSIRDTVGIINQPYDKVRRWFLKLSEANYEGLSDSVKTDIDNRRISFHGLVELVVIGELLEAGVKPKKIFEARKVLSSIVHQPYPFATSDVNDKLHVSGNDIVFDFKESLVTLDSTRQFNLNFIREFFADIVFETRIAVQLLPAKGLKRIQINPKAAGGRPAFVSQKDVKVETILRFYKGPDSVEEIIEDYGISEEDIKAALAYQS